MLRRILMAILIACLAGPAIAMPLAHDHAPFLSMIAPHHNHGQHRPEPATPVTKDDCIGCLTPIEPPTAPGAVRAPAPILPRPGLAYFLSGTTDGPEIPPPRT